MNDGINCIFWKSFAHIPIIKPNKLKVKLIRIRNNNIQNGCKIVISIKKAEVIKIISPINTDLLAAANT